MSAEFNRREVLKAGAAAAVGATVRFGMDLPSDFGPPRIRPSLPGSALFDPGKDWAWYFFAGVEGRYVLHNIFLDGNTFSDSHSVDKEPLVGDFQVGAAITVGRMRLAYIHLLRTREFKQQDVHDRFGVISVAFKFWATRAAYAVVKISCGSAMPLRG